MIRESWDLSWMAAATQSLETYEAALETAEFPSILLAALDELLQAPETNAEPLRELSDILLQMIEFPIDLELPQETVTTLHAARDWAIQTLLGVQTAATATENFTIDILPLSLSLQKMQRKLFVSAPCRVGDVELELHRSLLAEIQEEQEGDTLSEVLEMSATSVESDDQFLQFADAALSSKTEALELGTAFLQRLFDRQSVSHQTDGQRSERSGRQGRRLFDSLALESKIRVWANHLPSWRSQLQKWMLEAHRTPLEVISAVLPDGWWYDNELSTSSLQSIAVTESCQRYSHLYVSFIEWCRTHVDLLSSCRCMELVSVLSRSTRQTNASSLFNRQLLSHVPMIGYSSRSWSLDQRKHVFTALGKKLEELQATHNASDISWQYEWIGVLERSNLIHEALDVLFCGDSEASTEPNENPSAAHYATQFLSWFYSYSSVETAHEIAAILTQVASKLQVPAIGSGAQWIRRNRADFGILPILRLRLVWIWLLKSIEVALETSVRVSDSHFTSTTTDVLESVEYIFRRFTPSRAKRLYQVELVTQLLLELEWCATNTNLKRKDAFLDLIAPLCAWLTKIVRLMQLEEQTAHQKENRSRYANRRNPSNDVDHLAERLLPFTR